MFFSFKFSEVVRFKLYKSENKKEKLVFKLLLVVPCPKSYKLR